jgi:hypothetical protein
MGLTEFFANRQGVPGIGAFQSDDASLRDLRSLSYVRFEQPRLADLPVDLSSTGSFVFERERFRDVAGEIGLGSVANDNRTYTGALDNLFTRSGAMRSRRGWTSAARSSRRTTPSPPTRTVPTRVASVSISPPATRWASSVIACSSNRASVGSTSTTTSAAPSRPAARSCGRAGAAAATW